MPAEKSADKLGSRMGVGERLEILCPVLFELKSLRALVGAYFPKYAPMFSNEPRRSHWLKRTNNAPCSKENGAHAFLRRGALYKRPCEG